MFENPEVDFVKSGADPGFLGRGFICIKVWGFHFADSISFFLNIPMMTLTLS